MTTNQPLISVVIPAYNRADKIAFSIKSVQNQTYHNWEIVISDDGSTDNTGAVVEDLMAADNRIRLIRHESNAGAQAARNAGIRAAKGEWIAFLDSDDQLLPDSLALRLAVAHRDNVSVVHSEAYIQRPNEPLDRYYIPNWSGNIYRRVLSKEGPVFPSLLVKKSALEHIGYLDEKIKSYQEWDTCIRLAKHFEFGFEPQPTFIYDYRTPNAISRDAVRAGIGYEQSLSKHWRDILRHLGTGALASHYEVAAKWYRQGQDEKNARRCSRLAVMYKMLSPSRVLQKIKHALRRSPVNAG
jgi:glycosyltransferase involved in cell wall biosynthesis